MMASDSGSLINKYRPRNLDQVIGHESVIRALFNHLTDANVEPSRAYLLTGIAGVGKTTIARLIAQELNIEDVTELDAAEHSGVEDMRSLMEDMSFTSMYGSGRRMVLIDECHRLSTAAWSVLLKPTEEPPAHLWFAFCTTESNKVPPTIAQRCYGILLRPVHQQAISQLLDQVLAKEEWTIPISLYDMIIDNAGGSPRRALSLLQIAIDAKSTEHFSTMIELQEASGAILELARCIVKRFEWNDIKRLFPRISDDEFERASNQLGRYILAVMLKSDEKQAKYLSGLLDALVWPAASYDRKILFMSSLCRMLWS